MAMRSTKDTNLKTLLFRTDASSASGTGHLMRCLALAEICKEHGYTAVFAMSECPQALVTRVQQAEMETILLSNPFDASQIKALVKQVQASAIVIDGYHFTEQYRHDLLEASVPILALDDGVSSHPLHAHRVLNASPLASENTYQTIAPGAQLFLGPGFAPLRSEFRQRKAAAMTETPQPQSQRILITFGGSDPLKLSLPMLQAVLRTLPEQAVFDVVVGGAATDHEELRQFAQTQGQRIQLHHNTTQMAELMQQARLAISAAGSTLWELAYLAVPTIALVVADNQAIMLKPPLRQWFETIDARSGTQDAVAHAANTALALWQDEQRHQQQRNLLHGIGVGEQVSQICAALAAPMEKVS